MTYAQDFGAVGDGQTDDTAALQHAIDQTGLLQFTKGHFRITRPIDIDLTRTGYAGVRGEQGATRIIMDGPGPAFRITGTHQGTASPGSFQDNVWEGERFPVISGLEILGRHEEADGIQLQRTMQCTVQNVLIRHCRYGIHLVERNRNFLLAASHIYDLHDSGVFFDHCNLHQTIITGNHISYCKRAGIRQLDGDVHNIQITGNDIEYNSGLCELSAEILLEAATEQISEYTISSNTIQATRESPGANILIRGLEETPSQHAKLIAITGNVIGSRQRSLDIAHVARLAITGNTIYDGIQRNVTLRHCQNVVLSGNSICTRPVRWDSQSTDGVTLEDCDGGLIQGNILNDCKPGPDEPGGALVLKNCRRFNIANNQITDPYERGIVLRGSTHCLVQGNSVIAKPDRPLIDPIAVDDTSTHITVANNALW